MPTSFKVIPRPFHQSLMVPASKSYSNRLLVLASLDSREITIENISSCSDTRYLLNAIKETGVNIDENTHGVIISNQFPFCEKKTFHPIPLFIGDGGTSSRFLLAFLAKGRNRYHLYADDRLQVRPIEELIHALRSMGVDVRKEKDCWISIQGPICEEKKQLVIDGSRSGQFASALALAFNDGMEIKMENQTSSKRYFELTKNLIGNFKTPFLIPPDFSSASYPLALALACGRVLVSNIKELDEWQADSSFIPIARKMGGHIFFDKEGLRGHKGPLEAIELDCSEYPDLVPTLAFLCTRTEGESRLSGLGILRYKECNRLEEIEKLLKLAGHMIRKERETLFIRRGRGRFFHYHAPCDHRMVMTAYLFMRADCGGLLENIKSVAKSYPDFFTVMENEVIQ